jgi:hypothetical protein
MMKKTKDAVRYLQEGVKKMKLTNFDGENVDCAVSLLRGTERRFKNTSGVPKDYTRWVLDIFKTSSVTKFNEQFALYDRLLHLGNSVDSELRLDPSLNELYQLAENTYNMLLSTNKWTGITTKGDTNPSGFATDGGGKPPRKPPVCWNCDGVGHRFPECTKPANAKHIEANRLKNCQNRGGGAPGSKKSPTKPKDPKWAPPTKAENGHHVIDGKPCYWNRRWKRWCLEKSTPDARITQAPAPASSPPIPASLLSTSGSTRMVTFANTASRRQARDVAFSNMAHVITEALRGLSQSLK